MIQLIHRVWQDDRGFVNSAELVLIATLTIIGMIVGLATLRDGVTQELADTGAAVGQVNQSYNVELAPSPNQDPELGPAVMVAGDEVTISRDFSVGGSVVVRVSSGFNNFRYDDETDIGDGQDSPNTLPPGILSFEAATDEGAAP